MGEANRHTGTEARRHEGSGLSPWPVRVGAFAALVVLAVVAIWFIDRRAMVIQREHGWTHARDASASSPPLPPGEGRGEGEPR